MGGRSLAARGPAWNPAGLEICGERHRRAGAGAGVARRSAKAVRRFSKRVSDSLLKVRRLTLRSAQGMRLIRPAISN